MGMSVKGVIRDLLILSTLIALLVTIVVLAYSYFASRDAKFLYIGLFVGCLLILGAIARYRFVIDYVWTLLKKWR